jgi:Lon protease-like protein
VAGAQRKNVFLFPLGTVLFPGGILPLKIFEQRYLDMTKACLRDSLPFGVCLIREGREVGTAAVPESVGCLATIEQWDMPHTGMFYLLARGGERFRILETQVAANGLLSGDVEMLPPPAPCAPEADCVALLERVITQVGADHFPQPLQMDNGTWVAYRLAEMLPMAMAEKQLLLQDSRAESLFDVIKKSIKSNT